MEETDIKALAKALVAELKKQRLVKQKKWLTIGDFQELTGFKPAYIKQLCRENRIKYSKPTGKEIFISTEAYNEFMESGVIPTVKEVYETLQD